MIYSNINKKKIRSSENNSFAEKDAVFSLIPYFKSDFPITPTDKINLITE